DHRRLCYAHHGDFHAVVARRIQGQGLPQYRRYGVLCGRRDRFGNDRGSNIRLQPARCVCCALVATSTADSQRRSGAVQLFRSTHTRCAGSTARRTHRLTPCHRRFGGLPFFETTQSKESSKLCLTSLTRLKWSLFLSKEAPIRSPCVGYIASAAT